MSNQVEIDRLKTRVNNLEEVVKKLLTLYSNLASNKQVQELVAVVTDDLKTVKEDISSLSNRVEILEEIPDIDF